MNKGENFVIIPAYNEGGKIKEVIEEVKKYSSQIIVVDDGSHDNTTEIAEQQKVILLRHKINLGKGAALRTGCDYALELGAEKMVVIDADGQHQPQQITAFLASLENNDIAFGCRKKSKSMPAVLKLGNYFINSLIKILCKIQIKDSQCGYRAFSAAAYHKIKWRASDYYMETEMVINTAKNKLKYVQIPIETIYSDKYKGTTVLDGVKIAAKIISQGLFG